MITYFDKYAQLLTHYCLELKKGDKLLIKSTTVAEPLVKAVYREALKLGVIVDTILNFEEENELLINHGNDEQLAHVNPLYKTAIHTYSAYLNIRAPFERKPEILHSDRTKVRQEALKDIFDVYFERTGNRSLKRSLCQFPTKKDAQRAGMSHAAYQDFVFKACKLDQDEPAKGWIALREKQQQIVDKLAQYTQFTYRNKRTDITFSTAERIWINSDGRTNMPSGEVYTSPVEDSVNGTIHFSYPGYYNGVEVENVVLEVKDGWIESWQATKGKDFLDTIFQIEGTRRFGEAAIGTNYDIDQITKNILFDEKIGGSVHMAIGQSYRQAGGKNNSPVHWDMITDMTADGEIWADGIKIYEKGQFLFLD